MSIRMSHDDYFLSLVELVAERSTCQRRRVGAILVDINNRILATGYNGVPQSFQHCIDSPCRGVDGNPGAKCMSVHAEQNALLQCAERRSIHTLYVSTTPCFDCAKMLANTSLKRVVASSRYTEHPVEGVLWSGLEVLRVANIDVFIRKGNIEVQVTNPMEGRSYESPAW